MSGLAGEQHPPAHYFHEHPVHGDRLGQGIGEKVLQFENQLGIRQWRAHYGGGGPLGGGDEGRLGPDAVGQKYRRRVGGEQVVQGIFQGAALEFVQIGQFRRTDDLDAVGMDPVEPPNQGLTLGLGRAAKGLFAPLLASGPFQLQLGL